MSAASSGRVRAPGGGESRGAQEAENLIGAAPIRGLVFDVDGTLYRQGPVRRGMAARLLAHLVWHPTAGWQTVRFIRAYRRAQEKLRRGDEPRSSAAQLLEACRQTGAEHRWAAEAVADWMDRKPLDLVRRHMRADLTGLLEEAGRRGLRLGVFSDYHAEAKLEAMGIRHFFDVVRCAQEPEIGAFKPDPRGLRCTVQALGIEPAHALYVGDRPEVDAAAAQAAGMRAAIIGSTSASAGDSCVHVRTFTELAARLEWT